MNFLVADYLHVTSNLVDFQFKADFHRFDFDLTDKMNYFDEFKQCLASTASESSFNFGLSPCFRSYGPKILHFNRWHYACLKIFGIDAKKVIF